jgi:hypothetical protein
MANRDLYNHDTLQKNIFVLIVYKY